MGAPSALKRRIDAAFEASFRVFNAGLLAGFIAFAVLTVATMIYSVFAWHGTARYGTLAVLAVLLGVWFLMWRETRSFANARLLFSRRARRG